MKNRIFYENNDYDYPIVFTTGELPDYKQNKETVIFGFSNEMGIPYYCYDVVCSKCPLSTDSNSSCKLVRWPLIKVLHEYFPEAIDEHPEWFI